MSEILRKERKPTGTYYPSGTPVMREYYLIRCAHCNTELEVLKGNYKVGKRCSNCRNIKHGSSATKLYKVFTSMKQRCENPKIEGYSRYGGKGVKVLFKDFAEFEQWATNNGYKEGLTIDRRDSSGNYEPDNCRWISASLNFSLPNRKPVHQVCLDTGAIIATHVSAKAAAGSLGVKDASSILKVCKGQRNKANGYSWAYAALEPEIN